MAAVAGFWNHSMAATNPLNGAKPMDGSSSSSSNDPGAITSNDFLTLLVTEMKNQDPTANTDPNEYINQLVQVNSLQQLISINQTLTTDLGTPATGQAIGTAATSSAANPAAKPQASATAQSISAGTAARTAATNAAAAVHNAGVKTAGGNLSVPEAKPAAQRVAQALSGRL